MNVRAAFTDRTRHKFTLEDWAAMESAGILPADRDFELIDGDLVEMPSDGPGHRRYQHAVLRWLIPRLPAALAFSVDQTLPKDRHNGPKPDMYVFPADKHERSLSASDVLWVIEIADTSLKIDREVKAQLYAEAGIADYWIIDIAAKAIHVHRAPSEAGYAEITTITAEETAFPLCLPELGLSLAALPRLD